MKRDKHHISKLENVEKKEIFSAPDGYFEQLQNNVFDKINSIDEQASEPKSKQRFFNPFWMSVAAAITVLLITFFSLRDSVKNIGNDDYYALISEVSSDEIIAYLEQSELSISEIEQALGMEDLEDLPVNGTDSFDSYTEEELDDLYEYYSL